MKQKQKIREKQCSCGHTHDDHGHAGKANSCCDKKHDGYVHSNEDDGCGCGHSHDGRKHSRKGDSCCDEKHDGHVHSNEDDGCGCGHSHDGHKNSRKDGSCCDVKHDGYVHSNEDNGCCCGNSHDGHVHTVGDTSCGCGVKHDGLGHEEDGCGCGHQHGERSKQTRLVFWLRAGAAVVLLLLGWLLPVPEVWRLAFLIPSYIIIGADVVLSGLKGLLKGKALDERFLMTIASVGAFLVGEAPEGVLVMLLYQIGEFLTDLSVERSRRSVSALTKLRPDRATIVVGGAEQEVAPETVEVGWTIAVRPGERVPLDGKMQGGTASFDLSALTGESKPVVKREGDEVPAGAVNLDGRILLTVTKPFGQSAVMRILETVSDAAEKKTKTERFIKRFAKYYTPAVVAIAALVAVVPPLIIGGEWMRFVHTALLFLVISCPCALVIAVPLTYFAGVGGASKQGILVKGGTVFDALKKVKTVVFDKTGTLTEGVFKVREILPSEGISEQRLTAAAAAAERYGNHPIAKSIREALGESAATLDAYAEYAGEGVSVVADGRKTIAGNLKLMQRFGVDIIGLVTPNISGKNTLVQKLSNDVGSVVYVAEDGVYLGLLRVADQVKPKSAAAIAGLKAQNIKTVMLTGDREEAARAVAQELGVDEYRAGLLPEDKVTAIEEILSLGGAAFVGDGINDAPVLTRADVGFAMGGIGQDAAIEAADVVVMDDNPEKVGRAIKISKKTSRIALQNIIFALGVKLIVMALGFAGVVNMWLAVFADVGVTLIAIVNALRAYRTLDKPAGKK